MAAIILKTIPSFYAKKFRTKVSVFLQVLMKNTLFEYTTASPITTIRRVLYPFVNITIYYLEILRNCYINWIHSDSPGLSTYTVQAPFQRKNFCKEWKCV